MAGYSLGRNRLMAHESTLVRSLAPSSHYLRESLEAYGQSHFQRNYLTFQLRIPDDDYVLRNRTRLDD